MNPTIHVAAGITYREDGRFLIARKKEGKSLAGFWEFPGGKIENGESPGVALIRELNEELKITVTDIRFLTIYSFTYPDSEVILHFYECQLQSGNIKLVDHDAVEWVTVSEAGSYNLAPADLPVLKFLEARDKDG